MPSYCVRTISIPPDVDEILSNVGLRNVSPYIVTAIRERDRGWRRALANLKNAGYSGVTIRDMLKGWEYAIVLLKRDDHRLEYDIETLRDEKSSGNKNFLSALDSI